MMRSKEIFTGLRQNLRFLAMTLTQKKRHREPPYGAWRSRNIIKVIAAIIAFCLQVEASSQIEVKGTLTLQGQQQTTVVEHPVAQKYLDEYGPFVSMGASAAAIAVEAHMFATNPTYLECSLMLMCGLMPRTMAYLMSNASQLHTKLATVVMVATMAVFVLDVVICYVTGLTSTYLSPLWTLLLPALTLPDVSVFHNITGRGGEALATGWGTVGNFTSHWLTALRNASGG